MADRKPELLIRLDGNVASSSSANNQQTPHQYLHVKVEYPDGQFNDYRLKENTPFKKLFSAFSRQNNIEMERVMGTLRFTFDGVRVQAEDTPSSLNIEDNDVISVYSMQTGGRYLPGTRRRTLVSAETGEAAEAENYPFTRVPVALLELFMSALHREMRTWP